MTIDWNAVEIIKKRHTKILWKTNAEGYRGTYEQNVGSWNAGMEGKLELERKYWDHEGILVL